MGATILIMMLGLITAILLVVGLTMKTERQILLDRVRRYGYEETAQAAVLADDLTPSFADRILRPMLRRIGRIGDQSPQRSAEILRKRLETAGNPHNLVPLEFTAMKGLGMILGLVIGATISFLTDISSQHKLLLLILCAGGGFYLPEKWLAGKIAWRKNEIQRALPNAIDLLNVSIEAGLGFDAAIARIVDKTSGPLADECQRALVEMRMGKARVDALRDMATRTEVADLGSFVAAVYQAEELGASLTTVLRVQGQMIRAKRSMRAREMAAKLPIKLLFPLVFFIFPSIFIVVLGPGAIQLSKTLFAQ